MFFHKYLQVIGVWFFPWQPSLCSQPNSSPSHGVHISIIIWSQLQKVWPSGSLGGMTETFHPSWMGGWHNIIPRHLHSVKQSSHPFKEKGSSILNWIMYMERTALTPEAGKTVGEGFHFRQASRFALPEAHPHRLKKNPYIWSESQESEVISRAQCKIRFQCLLLVSQASLQHLWLIGPYVL